MVTIRLSATGPALSPYGSPVFGQTGSGDIGGMLVAVVLLVALGLAAVTVWHGGLSGIRDRLRRSAGSTTEHSQGDGADSATVPAEPTSPAEPDAGRQPESAGSVEQERSDRDVVLDILGENDGRMKQARIVDATDWSKSKVSMVLSEMEEDGDITKLRVGRENIISLEGSEPEAAGSPFDDE